MIAGPNGSGKSTLTEHLLASGIDLGVYINADEIEKALPPMPADARSKLAQARAEDQRQACIAEKRSFAFETVMSHSSKVDLLAQARAAGFSVVIFFIALENPRLNVERVRQRVQLGGHPVPEDRIIARYERCLQLLPAAIAQCDRAVLFDNSYRERPGSRVDMKPFCEIVRRTPEIAPGSFEYLNDAGSALLTPDILKAPRWSVPLLQQQVIGDSVRRTWEALRAADKSKGGFQSRS